MHPDLQALYDQIVDGSITEPSEIIAALARRDEENKRILQCCHGEDRYRVLIALRESLARLTIPELKALKAELLTADVPRIIRYAVSKMLIRKFVVLPSEDPAVTSMDLDLQQYHIRKQLKNYLKSIGADPSIIKSAGSCFGLAVCTAAMAAAGKLDWWHQVLSLVFIWNSNSDDLDTEITLRDGKKITYREVFERVIHYVVYHHGRFKRSSVSTTPTSESAAAEASAALAVETGAAPAASSSVRADEAVDDDIIALLPKQSGMLEESGPFELDVETVPGRFETRRIKQSILWYVHFNEESMPLEHAVNVLAGLLADPIFRQAQQMVTLSNINHRTALTYDSITELLCFNDSNVGPRYFPISKLTELASLILSSLKRRGKRDIVVRFSIAAFHETPLVFSTYQSWLAVLANNPESTSYLVKLLEYNLKDSRAHFHELIFDPRLGNDLLKFCINNPVTRRLLGKYYRVNDLGYCLQQYLRSGGSIAVALQFMMSSFTTDGSSFLSRLDDKLALTLLRTAGADGQTLFDELLLKCNLVELYQLLNLKLNEGKSLCLVACMTAEEKHLWAAAFLMRLESASRRQQIEILRRYDPAEAGGISLVENMKAILLSKQDNITDMLQFLTLVNYPGFNLLDQFDEDQRIELLTRLQSKLFAEPMPRVSGMLSTYLENTLDCKTVIALFSIRDESGVNLLHKLKREGLDNVVLSSLKNACQRLVRRDPEAAISIREALDQALVDGKSEFRNLAKYTPWQMFGGASLFSHGQTSSWRVVDQCVPRIPVRMRA